MISLSRAPASADFLLPRRAAYWWFEGFIRAQQTPGLRSAISWAALLLAGAGLAAWIAALARELAAWDPAARTLRRFLLCAAAVLGTAWAGRWALSLFLEISSSAWFPPESLDWREPALAFLAANHAAWKSSGIHGFAGPRERRGPRLKGNAEAFFSRLVILVLPASLLCAIGVFRDDLGKNNLGRGGGCIVPTLDWSRRAARGPGFGPDRGDPLARLLLLRNLSRAPASPENLAAPAAGRSLRWRIGPAALDALAGLGAFRRRWGRRAELRRPGIRPAYWPPRGPGPPAAGVVRAPFAGLRGGPRCCREPGPAATPSTRPAWWPRPLPTPRGALSSKACPMETISWR